MRNGRDFRQSNFGCCAKLASFWCSDVFGFKENTSLQISICYGVIIRDVQSAGDVEAAERIHESISDCTSTGQIRFVEEHGFIQQWQVVADDTHAK